MSETRTPAKKKPAAKTPRARAKTAGKGKTIVIEQYASGIGCIVAHKRTVRSLGLLRIRHRVVRPDNPAVRGMVESIPHIVRIVEA
jgi:large subunit ribosomal protein L30